ncbi:MAG: ShlB/FhaC/HecB family hemolysin secretion/activation protein [Cyanobacteria bacterium SBLK]|nr:ShlB/FhaC/HecB family hemolysin secretion/activation protein [Cyanobacteria bacterium SBLK]
MSKKDILSGASIALLVASLLQTKASAQIDGFSTTDDRCGEQESNIAAIAPHAIAELPISEESALDFGVSIPLNAIEKKEKNPQILPSLKTSEEIPLFEKNFLKENKTNLLESIKPRDKIEIAVVNGEKSPDGLDSISESSPLAAEEDLAFAGYDNNPLTVDSESRDLSFAPQPSTEEHISEEREIENESDLATPASSETLPDPIAPTGREIANQWGAIEREMLPSFWHEEILASPVKSAPEVEKRRTSQSPTHRTERRREKKEHLKKKSKKELSRSFPEIPSSPRSARGAFIEGGIFPQESLWQATVATLEQTPATAAELPPDGAIATGELCPISFPAIANEPIAIGNLTISGATAFSEERIRYIISQALRELGISLGDRLSPERLSPEQRKAIANDITQLYLESGYLTSRAFFRDDNILKISEGRLAEITVRGRKHLNIDYICDRLLLGVETPFNAGKLEEQLRLMQESPLFENIEASLTEAGFREESHLTVNVTEAKKFYGTFGVDNYSPAAVGSERMGLSLGDRNLTGRGDRLHATYSRSTTGGTDLLDLSYQIPLNAKEGTLQLRFAPNWTEITQSPFDQLDIDGRRRFYGIHYRQPLVRNLRQEFALSLGFNRQEGQTFIFDRPLISFEGIEEDGSSRTSTITFAQEYLHRDRQGVTAIGSQFNFGVGLLGVTTNESPTPDGLFFSWSGQVQRVQRLGDDRLLLAQLDVQLTPDALLPAHQFIIGGGQSVRGYRQNARGGDNGIRLLVEGRLPVTRNAAGEPEIQLAPFFNAGKVWNHPNNPNQLSDRKFLAGVGMGILWEGFGGIDNLKMRLDYGVPLIYLADRGKNVQDNGLYFKMQVEF